MQYHVNFDIWDWLIFQSFLIEFTDWEKLHFCEWHSFFMFWNLSLKSLATNRSPSQTAKPFGDKKVEVIPHVIDVAWALN